MQDYAYTMHMRPVAGRDQPFFHERMMACAHPFRDLAKPSISTDRPWSCQTKQKNFFFGAQKKFFMSPRQTRGERVSSL